MEGIFLVRKHFFMTIIYRYYCDYYYVSVQSHSIWQVARYFRGLYQSEREQEGLKVRVVQ